MRFACLAANPITLAYTGAGEHGELSQSGSHHARIRPFEQLLHGQHQPTPSRLFARGLSVRSRLVLHANYSTCSRVYVFSYKSPVPRFTYYFQYHYDDDFETLYETLANDPANQAKVARLGPSLGSGNVRVAIKVRL